MSQKTELRCFVCGNQKGYYLTFLVFVGLPRSANETSLSFLRPNSILSGILQEGEHVVLDTAGSPYQSDGLLIIDGYLEIMPNVTIQFEAGSSLIVRKGNMNATGTPDAPISLTNLTEGGTWAGLVVNELYLVSPGFKMLLAYDEDVSYSVGGDAFNRLFEESQSKVLFRYCPQCTTTHKHIFYKRSMDALVFDAYSAMACNWTSEDNVFNVDFGV